MGNTIKNILIADDHQLVRLGLHMIVNRIAGEKNCYMAANGAEAVEYLTSVKIDLAILDISMPEKSGIEVLEFIKTNNAIDTRVLMNSMHSDYGNIIQCKNSGAEGYIFKDATDEELQEAIETLLNGGEYYSPGAKRMMALLKSNDEYTREVSMQIGITAVEYTVLKLIINACDDEEIVNAQHITFTELQKIKESLFTKLKAKNTTDLVRIAFEKHIV